MKIFTFGVNRDLTGRRGPSRGTENPKSRLRPLVNGGRRDWERRVPGPTSVGPEDHRRLPRSDNTCPKVYDSRERKGRRREGWGRSASAREQEVLGRGYGALWSPVHLHPRRVTHGESGVRCTESRIGRGELAGLVLLDILQ